MRWSYLSSCLSMQFKYITFHKYIDLHTKISSWISTLHPPNIINCSFAAELLWNRGERPRWVAGCIVINLIKRLLLTVYPECHTVSSSITHPCFRPVWFNGPVWLPMGIFVICTATVILPTSIQAGAWILHFLRCFKNIATQRGTSVGNDAFNGPMSPCKKFKKII